MLRASSDRVATLEAELRRLALAGLPMPSPLSVDLRERVVAAVADGASMRKVAARFRVSASSASRWCGRANETGDVAPKPRGGDQRSHRIEAHAEAILARDQEQPTRFLPELRAVLAERGIAVSPSGLSRFFKRHTITRKKIRPTRPSNSGPT